MSWPDGILPAHREWLAAHAITPEIAAELEIRSITSVDDLPAGSRWAGKRALPAVCFPWRSPGGDTVLEIRPDTPVVTDTAPDGMKYLWPRDQAMVLNAVRPAGDAATVVLVEGTKQAIAAGAYAPDVAVYGMHGCRGWLDGGSPIPDLSVVEDRDLVVILDADLATNLDVWRAAEGLAEAARMCGALSVRYVRIPATGKTGLDDLLARIPPEKRAANLARLIERAEGKLPRQPRGSGGKRRASPVGTPERPMVYVDGDRREVIDRITGVLIDRWDRRRLFNHGEVLSQLTPAVEMKPVARGAFYDLLQDTCVTVRHGRGDGGSDTPDYGWPDAQTIDAVMSRSDRFVSLDRVTRAPFVRVDGSICQLNGYDESSRTMVVMDPALARIRVPEDPSDAEIALARKLLMEEWLGDLAESLAGQPDRANMLAMVLTPLTRSLYPVAPLAVIDGLQMGVGKNLLADCVMLLATGEITEPLPYSQDDDEENRKLITSAFRTGAELFIFDEAHVLSGTALARALTSARYIDRKLGQSQILGFPNRVTWISLGNNVRVEGDVVRRVYRIRMAPRMANPQDRPAESFRHPDLRAWTIANRPQLLQAGLTLVRAWFAKGQPPPPRGVSFGSFEGWERVLGGIGGVAGVPGFLDNLQEWRSETSTELSYWQAHVTWLHRTFGDRAFTTRECRQALVADPESEPPPRLTDFTGDPRAFSRELGKAWARIAGRFFEGGLRLVKCEKGAHGHVGTWMVAAPPSNGVVTLEVPPGGDGGIGGIPSPSRTRESFTDDLDTSRKIFTGVQGGTGGASPGPESAPAHAHTHEGPEDEASPPIPPSPPSLEDTEKPYAGVTQPSLFGEDAAASITPVTPRDYPRINVAEYAATSAVTLPRGAVVFDVETESAELLWRSGPEFIRLAATQTGDQITVTTDGAELARRLADARWIIGHNVMGFDLVTLARHHGLDLHALTREGRVVDTMLAAVLASPPPAGVKPEQVIKDYALDALGQERFGDGKTGDLKALAKEFGGFGGIPTDDERYVRYCAGDVDLAARLAVTNGRMSAYARREHRVAAVAAQMRLNGFRVNRDLLAERIAAGERVRAEKVGILAGRYGMPLHDAKGKPFKSPHASKDGKPAVIRAFADLGVTLPLTDKGQPSFGREALAEVMSQHGSNRDVAALVETVAALNGIRTVYQTVRTHLVGDRVHPDVLMFQASGRWSITDPGLTVMGKRGDRYHEREVFIPEEDHVIIAADLSQVDARVVAAHCQDPAYLDLFEPGRDSHAEIAQYVWGDPTRRQDAKIIGHGWNYGMGIAGLAAQCGDLGMATDFDRTMRERFPGLVQWKRDIVDHAGTGGLLDNGFGRKLRVNPARAYTQAPALMGQSGARDVMMEGLLRLPVDLLPYLRAVVHDEVVMSIPVAEADDIERAVIEALSFEWAPPGASRPVRIEAGLARRGRSWGEVYEK